MSYCPRCGAERAYSAEGPIMTIRCKSCGRINVELWGSSFPYVTVDPVFCPFCGNKVNNYGIGKCGEKILFCESCVEEFILLDEVE